VDYHVGTFFVLKSLNYIPVNEVGLDNHCWCWICWLIFSLQNLGIVLSVCVLSP